MPNSEQFDKVDATCLTIQRAVADYTRRTPPHLRDCDVLTGHIVRALRDAAPQAQLVSTAGRSTDEAGGGKAADAACTGDGNGKSPTLTEAPLAWLVFCENDPSGFDYMVFASEQEADIFACGRDEEKDVIVPLYRASAFVASATALPVEATDLLKEASRLLWSVPWAVFGGRIASDHSNKIDEYLAAQQRMPPEEKA